MKKTSAIALCACLLVIIGAVFFFSNFGNKSETARTPIKLSELKTCDSATIAESSSKETAGWATYANTAYGFSVKYPVPFAPVHYADKPGDKGVPATSTSRSVNFIETLEPEEDASQYYVGDQSIVGLGVSDATGTLAGFVEQWLGNAYPSADERKFITCAIATSKDGRPAIEIHEDDGVWPRDIAYIQAKDGKHIIGIYTYPQVDTLKKIYASIRMY